MKLHTRLPHYWVFSFWIALIALIPQLSFGQTFHECGATTPTKEDMLERANRYKLYKQNTLGKARTTYNIPIHYIIVNDDGGNSPLNDIEDLDNAINQLNITFTNGMQFYICDITTINNSAHHDIFLSSTNNFETLYDLYHVNDAINFYIVNSACNWLNAGSNSCLNGVGSFPDNTLRRSVVLAGSRLNTKTVPHEMGHFFDLYHTHQGSTDEMNPIPPSQPSLGDGIYDTPVDPRRDNCGTSCSTSNCSFAGYTYTPDRSNIMSYYQGCRVNFTSEQLGVMSSTLTTHSNRTYLLNPPSTCNNYSLIAAEGKIEKIKDNTGTSIVLIRQVEVFMTENGSTCSEETDGSSPINNYHYNPLHCGYLIPENVSVEVEPQRDKTAQWDNATFAAVNGVTAFDMLKIQRHILGLESLPLPYPRIAADVNRSGSITSFDRFLINRVILDPANKNFDITGSWQYVPSHYLEDSSFKSSFDANPFTATYNGSKTYNGTNSYLNEIDIDLSNANATNNTTWSFKAIKMGDINFSSTLSNQTINYREQEQSKSRNNSESSIDYYTEPLRNCIREGEEFTIEIIGKNDTDIAAYQLGFSFDIGSIAISKVQRSSFGDFSLDNFGLTELEKGELRTTWVNEKGVNLKVSNNNRKLFKLRLKALKDICDLKEVIKLDDNVLENIFLDENAEQIKGQIVLEAKSTGGKKEELRIASNKLLNIYPNPSNSSSDLSFEFEIKNRQKILITVSDQFGKTISKEMILDQGTHQINLDDTKRLGFGPLFYKVLLGEELINGTIIKH